ncbi:MAG: type II toxin-antitoxin system HicB family antitoxin [Agriterribacter sp.]
MSDILQYKDYHAVVHFSAEDDIFYGKVIGINDLISFEGESVRQLKKAFQEAIDDYLEACKELNKKPEKTYKGSFNVRIPSDLHREAAVFSAAQNISLNDFVRQAIDYRLKEQSRGYARKRRKKVQRSSNL